jgi:hypothetical protein
MEYLLVANLKNKQNAEWERWRPQDIFEKASNLGRAPSFVTLKAG